MHFISAWRHPNFLSTGQPDKPGKIGRPGSLLKTAVDAQDQTSHPI
jgi:hypothetical protein